MIPQHANGDLLRPRVVLYEGTEDIPRGAALCYDITRVGDGITVADPSRLLYVAKPSQTNARYFAGIAANDFEAPASGQAREITIYEPGSTCDVLLTETNVNALDFGLMYRIPDGKAIHRSALYGGGGNILALQSVDASTEDKLCKAYIVPRDFGCPLEEINDTDTLGNLCGCGVSKIAGDHGGETAVLPDGEFVGEMKQIIFLAAQSSSCTISGRFGIGTAGASSLTVGTSQAASASLVWTGSLWAVVFSIDIS